MQWCVGTKYGRWKNSSSPVGWYHIHPIASDDISEEKNKDIIHVLLEKCELITVDGQWWWTLLSCVFTWGASFHLPPYCAPSSWTFFLPMTTLMNSFSVQYPYHDNDTFIWLDKFFFNYTKDCIYRIPCINFKAREVKQKNHAFPLPILSHYT